MPKRRGNREGTIYQRRDGRWVASVSLSDGRRKSFYGKTREEVGGKLTSALKTVQDGIPIPSDQLQVGRFLREWLEIARHGVRHGTWRRYEQLLRLHAMPALGRMKMSRLEPRHLQKLYADCLTEGLKPATVRQLHAVLRRALGQAARWGTITRNVAALVSPPRVARHEISPLTAEQAKTLLRTATGIRLEALYVLALTTGMRIGELQALRWQDINLESGMLQVCHTLTRTPSGLQLTEPKSGRSRRRIALSPTAVEALRHHRLNQSEERLKLGPAWHGMDLVFANAVGRPMEAGNILRRSFWPLLDQAGIERRRFHDLRHTCATLLLQQGVHAKVVSELLGHSSIGLTLDTYSHVLPDMQQQAANAMDALFTAKSI